MDTDGGQSTRLVTSMRSMEAETPDESPLHPVNAFNAMWFAWFGLYRIPN